MPLGGLRLVFGVFDVDVYLAFICSDSIGCFICVYDVGDMDRLLVGPALFYEHEGAV